MLNNGIEFSITYFVMLLALLFMGAGRYVSVDYWIERALYKEQKIRFEYLRYVELQSNKGQ